MDVSVGRLDVDLRVCNSRQSPTVNTGWMLTVYDSQRTVLGVNEPPTLEVFQKTFFWEKKIREKK